MQTRLPLLAVAFVFLHAQKFRQPVFAPLAPKFIGGCELVWGVEYAEVDFNLAVRCGENRCAAGWAKVAVFVLVGVPCDGDVRGRKGCGGVKDCAVVFAAIKAVTNADTFGIAFGRNSDCAACATACRVGHFTLLYMGRV